MANDSDSERSETGELEIDLDFQDPTDYYPPGHENRMVASNNQQAARLPRHKSRKTIFQRLLHSGRKRAKKSEKQAMNSLMDEKGDMNDEDNENDDDFDLFDGLFNFDGDYGDEYGVDEYGDDEKKMSLNNTINPLNSSQRKARNPSFHNPLHFNKKLFKRSEYAIDRCLSSAVMFLLFLFFIFVFLPHTKANLTCTFGF